jgi:stalled ribosome alternative rescue factor ArfA
VASRELCTVINHATVCSGRASLASASSSALRFCFLAEALLLGSPLFRFRRLFALFRLGAAFRFCFLAEALLLGSPLFRRRAEAESKRAESQAKLEAEARRKC